MSKKLGNGKRIHIAVYVDDCLIVGPIHEVEKFKRQFMEKFSTKDLGKADHFIGIQIQFPNPNQIQISQSTYIKQIIREQRVSNCSPASIPMNPGEIPDGPLTDNPNEYRSLIGNLMYAAVGTRPDIAFAVRTLAKHVIVPNVNHVKAAKQLLRYLEGTTYQTITYMKSNNGLLNLVCYCDADWANDRTDRKSRTGYITFINGAPITWSTRKQPTVAISTTEAEYMAATQACKEMIWIRRFLEEHTHKQAHQ